MLCFALKTNPYHWATTSSYNYNIWFFLFYYRWFRMSPISSDVAMPTALTRCIRGFMFVTTRLGKTIFVKFCNTRSNHTFSLVFIFHAAIKATIPLTITHRQMTILSNPCPSLFIIVCIIPLGQIMFLMFIVYRHIDEHVPSPWSDHFFRQSNLATPYTAGRRCGDCPGTCNQGQCGRFNIIFLLYLRTVKMIKIFLIMNLAPYAPPKPCPSIME